MPSYKQVRIKDVLNICPGALVPADIKKLYTGEYSGTSATTKPYDGLFYSENYYGGEYQYMLINRLYAKKFLPMLRYSSGSTKDCVPTSATAGNYAYNIFPTKKKINFTVRESIGGAANFKYFRVQVYTTSSKSYNTIDSLTWNKIDGSSSGTLTIPLSSSYSTSGNSFAVQFGGMNTARELYYSDNVCSPGVWKKVGKYSGAQFGPADTFSSEETLVTTDKLDAVRYLTYKEYCYRVNHISVFVRNTADGAPGSKDPKPGNTTGSYLYDGGTCILDDNCSSYTCGTFLE